MVTKANKIIFFGGGGESPTLNILVWIIWDQIHQEGTLKTEHKLLKLHMKA